MHPTGNANAKSLLSKTVEISSAFSKNKKVNNFISNIKSFTSLEQIQSELKKEGFESSNLIIGIDFTKSNEYTGKNSFYGYCLHKIDPSLQNPYQKVISIIGKTLEKFDEDKMIPAFGFGDVVTKGTKVFPLKADKSPCFGFEEVLHVYDKITPGLILSGPTNFAPLIQEAIKIVKEEKDFHILLIICDGQVTSEKETIDAIVEASKYPLSIICIGVGDGPWDKMREFDDLIPERQFDNFLFVVFSEIEKNFPNQIETAFAVAALNEIPAQYKAIKNLKLL